MLLNSWFPLTDMSRTLREVDRVFNLVNHATGVHAMSRKDYPAIDIYNQEETTTLVAEVPGISPDKLELTVLDDSLVLKGERRTEYATGQECLRCERPHGAFSRTISLPDMVDPESIQADYKDGVLTVTMQKAAVAKPRKIEIQS